MKEPAQATYEAHAASFGINTPQIRKNQSTVNGPIPWDELPEDTKRRWRLSFDAGLKQHQENALATATQVANAWKDEKKFAEAVKASPPEPTKPKPIDTTGEKVKDA